jgi:microtubule-associated protein-like 6
VVLSRILISYLYDLLSSPFFKASATGNKNRPLFACFANIGSFQLVSGGKNHVNFWEIKGRKLKTKKGIFGDKGKIQAVIAGIAVGDKLVTGMHSGALYVWSGKKVERSLEDCHAGGVTDLFACPEPAGGGKCNFVSGGKDGVVKLWSGETMQPLTSLSSIHLTELPGMTRDADCEVRAVCWDEVINKVIVGTKSSDIFELSVDPASSAITALHEGRPIVQGHCKDELWGLAMHPKDPDLVATCGDDHTVRMWNIKEKRMVSMVDVGHMARALAFDPDGR